MLAFFRTQCIYVPETQQLLVSAVRFDSVLPIDFCIWFNKTVIKVHFILDDVSNKKYIYAEIGSKMTFWFPKVK